MELLNGKRTAEEIRLQIAEQVHTRLTKGGKRPHLAVILVGEDGGSVTYVNAKVKDCEQVGFKSTLIHLPETATEREILGKIAVLNADPDVDGFIVQLPLPKHINESKVLLAIDPNKDVDGFHPENVGRMALNLPAYLPATPYGILELIRHYGVPTVGKEVVVVGRSHIVGSPVSILLARNAYPGNATVTLAHSKTANLKEVCKRADILIAAIGKPGMITEDMVKEGAVVIDVGTTRVADETKKNGFRLSGDVDFDRVAPKTAYITPVPGGVGPMTRLALLLNTLHAVDRNHPA